MRFCFVFTKRERATPAKVIRRITKGERVNLLLNWGLNALKSQYCFFFSPSLSLSLLTYRPGANTHGMENSALVKFMQKRHRWQWHNDLLLVPMSIELKSYTFQLLGVLHNTFLKVRLWVAEKRKSLSLRNCHTIFYYIFLAHYLYPRKHCL